MKSEYTLCMANADLEAVPSTIVRIASSDHFKYRCSEEPSILNDDFLVHRSVG